MKKIISVFLALVMLLVPMSIIGVCAADVNDPVPATHIVKLPKAKNYTCLPYDLYEEGIKFSTYEDDNYLYVAVVDGADFSFQVLPVAGYSIKLTMVAYFNTDGDSDNFFNIEPLIVKDVYTIDAVSEDVTVTVDFVMEAEQASLFRFLLEFLQKIMAFFGKLFGQPNLA